jgi:hypothetical protein
MWKITYTSATNQQSFLNEIKQITKQKIIYISFHNNFFSLKKIWVFFKNKGNGE